VKNGERLRLLFVVASRRTAPGGRPASRRGTASRGSAGSGTARRTFLLTASGTPLRLGAFAAFPAFAAALRALRASLRSAAALLVVFLAATRCIRALVLAAILFRIASAISVVCHEIDSFNECRDSIVPGLAGVQVPFLSCRSDHVVTREGQRSRGRSALFFDGRFLAPGFQVEVLEREAGEAS
jgi:hypothetical protein